MKSVLSSFASACIVGAVLCLPVSSSAQWVHSWPYADDVKCFSENPTFLFAGNSNGRVLRTSDNGDNWVQTEIGLTSSFVFALAVVDTTLFAGTFSGVFRSNDNGDNWIEVNKGLTDKNIQALVVSGSTLFTGTYGGVFRTFDGGDNWEAANDGLGSVVVRALAVSGSTLFVGTDDDGVFRSTNGGDTWEAVNNGLPDDDVLSLMVSGTILFAGLTYDGGVYRSIDAGENWTEVNSGLINRNVRALTASGSTVFAGTLGGGVFRLSDNGDNWEEMNSGMTSTVIYALAVSGTTLFAAGGNAGGGVWRWDNITAVDSDPVHELPTGFQLAQNYPNPFNPATTIEYSVPIRSTANIEVLNLLGQCVRVLLDEDRSAGNYSVTWNGRDQTGRPVSSGVYLYRLRAGGLVQSRKMLLLK